MRKRAVIHQKQGNMLKCGSVVSIGFNTSANPAFADIAVFTPKTVPLPQPMLFASHFKYFSRFLGTLILTIESSEVLQFDKTVTWCSDATGSDAAFWCSGSDTWTLQLKKQGNVGGTVVGSGPGR